MTLSVFTSRNGTASAHLDKLSVVAKMKRCPRDEGGSIGPMTSIP
jgi:hypothetical protein